MTDKQIFDATTGYGSEEIQKVFRICDETGSWCLIGGLALNTYLERVPKISSECGETRS
jgi:hypothetical protein